MTVVIKGIKLLSKTKLGRKALSTAERVARRAISRKKARQSVKSVDKYKIHAGGQSTKGPVPVSKQSLVKSTLSGRTYSTRTPVRGRASEWRGHRGKGSGVAEFQSRVKDLIGLDSFSVRKAQERFLKRRNIKNRLRRKK